MTNLELWLQARGRLIILFILVVLPPAGTLVILGIQLLEQDRVAARQQQTEFLEQASEKGVRILEQDLAAVFVGATAAPNPKQEFPEDIIRITCSRDGITSLPPGRLPYFPAAPSSPELPGPVSRVMRYIWRVPLDGGTSSEFMMLPADLTVTSSHDISLHPTGKRIAFGSSSNIAEYCVMENLPISK